MEKKTTKKTWVDRLSKLQKVLIIAGAVVVVFLVLDFGYVSANIKFLFFKPKNIPITQTGTAAQPKTTPNTLIVSSLGIIAPVQYATTTGEPAFQAALINGPTHYPGSADPGQFGNCYIFGHSSDFIRGQGHYKTVFALLPKIQVGAQIVISDQQGNEFTYTVTDSREVAANDVSVLSQQNYQRKLLTLQTSYPVGTALARWVVVAEINQ